MKLLVKPRKLVVPVAGYSIRGELQVSVVDGKTKEVVRQYPVQKNLILNRFMEGLPNRRFPDMFTFAVASTGVTPTADDSGSTVAVQAGTGVTLSGGSLLFTDTATDAGKIIKWDSGEESRIVTVTSTTVAVVAPSQTVASGQFTIYRTNQNQMASTGNEERAGGSITGTSYLTGAGNCETLYTPAPTVTMTRTYDFKLRTDTNRIGTPYGELGWSELQTVGGATINSRVQLAVPVPVDNGQQLRVKYSLIVTLSPGSLETISSSPITGWSTATGKQQIQLPMLAKVLNTGASSDWDLTGSISALEPFRTATVVLLPRAQSALPNAYNTNGPSRVYASPQAVTTTFSTPQPTYAAGSSANALFIDKIAFFASSAGNGTWGGFVLGFSSGANGALDPSGQAFTYIMDNDQNKDSIHSLSLFFRFSWARTLG